MLMKFSVSNFLSFNEQAVLTMHAGKARKFGDRVYNDKKNKLTKIKTIFGANGSGKSNLILSLNFMRDLVLDGLPRGFSNKYFRFNSEMKYSPSSFYVDILIDECTYTYGFDILLAEGKVLTESLYAGSGNDKQKLIFKRNTETESFELGNYFKNDNAFIRLNFYGEDSSNVKDKLFLTIINESKGKLFTDFPELAVLKNIYEWFQMTLNISFPNNVLTGYPLFTKANITDISNLLNALGTGINELKIIEVSPDAIQNKIPTNLYNKVIEDLEKANMNRENYTDGENPTIMLRSYKEFFTFEIEADNNIKITTVEFNHGNEDIYFDLNEESDGTVRILDLIEILFHLNDNRVFVIDEIDRCLHPAMTVKIIELFLELAKKRNTQLIITTHESRLLAAEILRNDEICFVNKNHSGASELCQLEKIQLRSDKKVYAALFDGTIDSIPKFDDKGLNKFLKI